MLLGGNHPHQLSPACDQRFEFAGLRIRQWAGLRAHRRREPHEDPGIDVVRLGQLSDRTRVAPHLARIDDGHRDVGRRHGAGSPQLVPASGLEHHQDRLQRADPGTQLVHRPVVIRRLPRLAVRHTDVDGGLRHVHAHVDRFGVHSSSLPILANHAGSWPKQLYGLKMERVRRPCFATVFPTQNLSAWRTRHRPVSTTYDRTFRRYKNLLRPAAILCRIAVSAAARAASRAPTTMRGRALYSQKSSAVRIAFSKSSSDICLCSPPINSASLPTR